MLKKISLKFCQHDLFISATLDEAFKKLGQIMKDGESALTLSSGESATEVEKKEIDKIRQMQFIQEANQFKKTITDVPKAVRTSLKASTDNSSILFKHFYIL